MLEGFWNRWTARLRGNHHPAVLAAGGNGVDTAHASAALADAALHGVAVAEPRRWNWGRVWALWRREPEMTEEALQAADAPMVDGVEARVERLADRVDRLCDLLERHLTAQQSRTEEVLAAVQRLTRGIAAVPAQAAAQTQQVEQLQALVAAHHSDTRQITALLAEVPAVLCENRDALDSLVAHARTHERKQIETIDRLTDLSTRQAKAAETVQSVGAKMDVVAAVGESHSAALAALLTETRTNDQEIKSAFDRQSRRMMVMGGFVIGMTAASAVFGAIHLYLKLMS